MHGMLRPFQVSLFFLVLIYTCINCIIYMTCVIRFFQIRSLLDTLELISSVRSEGHLRLFSSLHIGHKRFPGEPRVLCWPFASKKLRMTKRQDWVFIRPPGTPLGTFQLKMDKVWFCKVLLLFSCVSKDDKGSKLHECLYVSVLEEYKGRRRPGCINRIK